jgi:mannose/cellobiose epimerase-like protein (N-acyl-D-glucosamine 2-epimerase family)
MNKSFAEWAAKIRKQRGCVGNASMMTLAADLEAAQAEHERELESLRERCAEEAHRAASDITTSSVRDAVRAVPLRRPREGE